MEMAGALAVQRYWRCIWHFKAGCLALAYLAWIVFCVIRRCLSNMQAALHRGAQSLRIPLLLSWNNVNAALKVRLFDLILPANGER